MTDAEKRYKALLKLCETKEPFVIIIDDVRFEVLSMKIVDDVQTMDPNSVPLEFIGWRFEPDGKDRD